MSVLRFKKKKKNTQVQDAELWSI